ncbi:cadmium, cobalt and zinc/H(+)-K(+) antiporter [bacterium BMS3Abin04]|nr:cadmium, cobalt and zinc/H(+)-K(+) antiporter [bacterium BMS3Abin04]
MAHHHHDENITGRRLIVTMLLNFLITIVEIIGGIISGSLSLISDALHNFSDGIAVIISYFALKLKDKPNSYKHTFGFKRAEILAALINSSALLAISFYLFYESSVRLLNPTEVQGGLMTIVAAVGLVANIAGTLLLKKGASSSINIKAAYLHLLSDAVSSVAVILGGIAIYYLSVYWLDPVLTILIAAYVLKESFHILTDALHVLMEGTPEGISLDDIKKAVESFEHVVNIHHIHVWSVGEKDIHLETHVNIDNMMTVDSDVLREKIEKELQDKFEIHHAIIQFECGKCQNDGIIKT